MLPYGACSWATLAPVLHHHWQLCSGPLPLALRDTGSASGAKQAKKGPIRPDTEMAALRTAMSVRVFSALS